MWKQKVERDSAFHLKVHNSPCEMERGSGQIAAFFLEHEYSLLPLSRELWTGNWESSSVESGPDFDFDTSDPDS